MGIRGLYSGAPLDAPPPAEKVCVRANEALSRRALVFLFPLAAFGQVKFDEELKDGDTSIVLFRTSEANPDEFAVGVSSSLPHAEWALTEVFYRDRVTVHGKSVEVVLHKESFGPVTGPYSYGATNQNFTIPKDKLKFVRVRLFEEIGKREFRG